MLKWTLGALLATLAHLPALAAAPACQPGGLATSLSAEVEVLEDSGAYEINPYMVFFAVPEELEAGSVVELRFLRRGSAMMTERVELAAMDASEEPGALDDGSDAGSTHDGTTVIEVLSTSPAERARLRALGTDGGVTVEVRADGQLVATLPFTELQARSEALLATLPRPAAITPRLVSASGASAFENTSGAISVCEENCYTIYDRCQDDCVWVPNSGPCFANCNANLNECLDDCNGTCNPSSTSTTTLTFLGFNPLPQVECIWQQGWGKDYYRLHQRLYKKTVTTTTTNADCSQTVTATVTYPFTYCWGFLQNGPCTQTLWTSDFC